MIDIFESTSSFENWMRQRTTVVESDLRHKHSIMKGDLFRFLKGTFYRWVQLWTEHAPTELKRTPYSTATGKDCTAMVCRSRWQNMSSIWSGSELMQSSQSNISGKS